MVNYKKYLTKKNLLILLAILLLVLFLNNQLMFLKEGISGDSTPDSNSGATPDPTQNNSCESLGGPIPSWLECPEMRAKSSDSLVDYSSSIPSIISTPPPDPAPAPTPAPAPAPSALWSPQCPLYVQRDPSYCITSDGAKKMGELSAGDGKPLTANGVCVDYCAQLTTSSGAGAGAGAGGAIPTSTPAPVSVSTPPLPANA